MRLAVIRREIDAVDQDLLALFNRRAALSLEVGHIKADVPGIIFKPIREKEVLDGLASGNPGPLPNDHLRAIWREIFSSSRSLQRPQNVAYLGPEGTFSYFAGVEYLGHAARFRPCTDITQVFQEVASGQCELGVVPLENSLQGTVGVSFDLFLKYDVHIQAELFSRISHCLLSNAPSMPLTPETLAPACREADLALICVPAAVFRSVIGTVCPHLPPTAVLADITSVKEIPLRQMESVWPGPVVGTHPLFGPQPDPQADQPVTVVPGKQAAQAHDSRRTVQGSRRRAGKYLETQAQGEQTLTWG